MLPPYETHSSMFFFFLWLLRIDFSLFLIFPFVYLPLVILWWKDFFMSLPLMHTWAGTGAFIWSDGPERATGCRASLSAPHFSSSALVVGGVKAITRRNKKKKNNNTNITHFQQSKQTKPWDQRIKTSKEKILEKKKKKVLTSVITPSCFAFHKNEGKITSVSAPSSRLLLEAFCCVSESAGLHHNTDITCSIFSLDIKNRKYL